MPPSLLRGRISLRVCRTWIRALSPVLHAAVALPLLLTTTVLAVMGRGA
jgi:hypothetical protein